MIHPVSGVVGRQIRQSKLGFYQKQQLLDYTGIETNNTLNFTDYRFLGILGIK